MKNQSPPQSEKKADTFSISEIEAVIAEDVAAEKLARGVGVDEIEEGERQSERLSPDAFYSVFKVMFAAPNMLPVKPFPIRSLPIQEHEEDAAREASDAIYAIACDTPYLSWLVEPGSEWVQRAMVIGAFFMGKLMVIRMELDARSRPPVRQELGGEVSAKESPPAGVSKASFKASSKGDAATVVNLK